MMISQHQQSIRAAIQLTTVINSKP